MINFAIVHYNTPLLTEACIKSINKHNKEAKIYVFENSDKYPLCANNFDNVQIFDNKGGNI